jgi:hypothetical protein
MPTTLTALPEIVDLNLYQGDDFVMALTVAYDNGDPADFTGAVVTAQIRRTTSDEDVLAHFFPTVNANVITLWLPSAESSKISGTVVWDCNVTDVGARVTTVATGKVTVTAEVTR